MPAKLALPILLLCAATFPQMPVVRDFYYKLAPREAQAGEAVTFEAFEFNMCLYTYDVTYDLLPTPISSKRTTIINMKAIVRPKCATAAGYSGPRAVFGDLQPGVYLLRFDSTGDFRRDLGDTNKFEVLPPASIGKPERSAKRPTLPWETIRPDGKALPGRKAKR